MFEDILHHRVEGLGSAGWGWRIEKEIGDPERDIKFLRGFDQGLLDFAY